LPTFFPVVQNSLFSRRVDPHSFIFLLKGNLTYDRILPYNRELLEPQKDLVSMS